MNDLIKREDAIERIKPMVGEWTDNGFMVSYERVLSILKNIPSAEPKRGEWINVGTYEECKDCGEVKRFPHWNFCPDCGARMKGADDEG